MKLSLRSMLFAAMFAALTAVGAFIKFPIPPYPVPMTLQTAFVYMAGLLLPPSAAFFSQLVYVLIGLIGVPVFANGGGLGYIFDPTFGYLLAFMAAAPLFSLMASRTLYKGKKWRFILGGFGVILMVQLIGVAYMALISSVHLAKPLELSRAIYLVYIFLPLDLVKLLLVSLLSVQLKKRAPRLFLNA
ncbi:MAG TPA: biotin transporter BioY [Feifaniaceae bacterium]|nr:biotin transporter BioY [Feifaniaceae bacterium]